VDYQARDRLYDFQDSRAEPITGAGRRGLHYMGTSQ
jgi:hypothetical protein